MILNETVAAIADAIREKTGKSELIAPVNFAEEIKSISAGGGSAEGGGSTIEYVSVEGKDLLEWGEALGLASYLVKMPTGVVPVSLQINMNDGLNDAIALALDPTIEFDLTGTRMTVADFLVVMGVDLSTYNRITKEEFYTL